MKAKLTTIGTLLVIPPLAIWLSVVLSKLLDLDYGKYPFVAFARLPETGQIFVWLCLPVAALGLSALAIKVEGRSPWNVTTAAVSCGLAVLALLAAFARQS